MFLVRMSSASTSAAPSRPWRPWRSRQGPEKRPNAAGTSAAYVGLAKNPEPAGFGFDLVDTSVSVSP